MNKILKKTDFSNVTFMSVVGTVNNNMNAYKSNIFKEASEYDINTVFIESYIERFFTNSEFLSSRCVAKFSSNVWDRAPNPVWMNINIPNYFLCNLYRILTIIIICCFLKNQKQHIKKMTL